MSGIYIKGMKMPEPGAYLIRLYVREDGGADIWGVGPYIPNEPLPAIPVPDHGRLGDLDKLEQMFIDIDNAPYSGFDGSEPFYFAEDAALIVSLSPTIIPADKEE